MCKKFLTCGSKWSIPLVFCIILFFVEVPYSALAYDLEKHIGLYKVVKTKYELTKGLHNPCPEIKFFELVKGRFYDIGSDEMAFATWKVYENDPIAGYEARLVKNHKKMLLHDNKIWLADRETKTETEKEFFILQNGKICGYQLIYIYENNAGKKFSRNFYYKLIPVSRYKIGDIKLLYPDNSDDTLKILPSLGE